MTARTAAIATKHGKDAQFRPPLRELLGVDLQVAEVDTDLLGTFTGEVTRAGTMVEAARRKALWAIDHLGTDAGLGSEGAYGPHPDAPFLAAGVEVAVWVDRRLGIEVVEQVRCRNTNHRATVVDTPTVPTSFLDGIGFPGHALVVGGGPGTTPVAKGVTEEAELRRAIERCLDRHGTAQVEADLRAHVNPTRQVELVRLAERLVRRLATRCPSCDAPGWGLVATEAGRPCGTCGLPTDLVGIRHLGCPRCEARRIEPVTDPADPAWCACCNP